MAQFASAAEYAVLLTIITAALIRSRIPWLRHLEYL